MPTRAPQEDCSESVQIMDEGFAAVIARHLASIDHKLSQIREEIADLKSAQTAQSVSASVLADPNIHLPCCNEQELTLLENYINADLENEKTVENLMSLTGGETLNAVVPKILEKIFTAELAKKFNWTGKNKMKLSSLKLMELLFNAVRKNPPTSSATDHQIIERIQVWFKHSGDRDGGRKRRVAPKHSPPQKPGCEKAEESP
ncbi:Hydra magnipapillata [Nesidiocoris tenuis]|uniref:Hydra magnipapillata n=1 Tax=Nesidiocoris tenuis TaxID=355587 RepID=A0ABN7AIN0_9HEMI|nr:Hydra magnipapillata [Nesidiocoris tenuis]